MNYILLREQGNWGVEFNLLGFFPSLTFVWNTVWLISFLHLPYLKSHLAEYLQRQFAPNELALYMYFQLNPLAPLLQKSCKVHHNFYFLSEVIANSFRHTILPSQSATDPLILSIVRTHCLVHLLSCRPFANDIMCPSLACLTIPFRIQEPLAPIHPLSSVVRYSCQVLG
jgi:hypothetical protein